MERLDSHYARLLGLEEPWEIEDVDLDLPGKRVEISLEPPNGVGVECPSCSGGCPIADRAPERRWRLPRHDGLQDRACCPCAPCGLPQVRCEDHPRAVGWEGGALHAGVRSLCHKGDRGVRERGQGGSTSRDGLGDSPPHHGEGGRARPPERRRVEGVEGVGMDEKSFRSGHRYISLLNDLEGGRVLEVAEGRKQSCADALWEGLGPGREGVRAVALDMWEPFVRSARENVPWAEVVHDRYHVSAHLNRAVDQVRRKENREPVSSGSDELKGSRYLWLFNVENLTEKRWMRLEPLLESDLKTAGAWALKENMRWFWE